MFGCNLASIRSVTRSLYCVALNMPQPSTSIKGPSPTYSGVNFHVSLGREQGRGGLMPSVKSDDVLYDHAALDS